MIYALRFVAAVGIQQSRLNTPYAFCDVDEVEVAGWYIHRDENQISHVARSAVMLFMSYTGGCYLWANK